MHQVSQKYRFVGSNLCDTPEYDRDNSGGRLFLFYPSENQQEIQFVYTSICFLSIVQGKEALIDLLHLCHYKLHKLLVVDFWHYFDERASNLPIRLCGRYAEILA